MFDRRELDVSELEPCEPLEQTLAAVAELPRGGFLKVLHRREPHPLFPMLEKQGMRWRCVPGETKPFEIYIWHADDVEVSIHLNKLLEAR